MDREPRVPQCNLFRTKTEFRDKNPAAKGIVEADRVLSNLETRQEKGQADASREKK